jgi:hypothetical protein
VTQPKPHSSTTACHQNFLLAKSLIYRGKKQVMKKFNMPLLATLLVLMFTISSCEVIGGIFKAGVWSGIIIVVVIIVLVIWLIGRSRK